MTKWFVIFNLAVGFIATAQADDLDIGKSEFQSSCASCHGMDGKGKGPVSNQLKILSPDLTILAKNNNGVFPTDSLYEIIDGSRTIPGHGTREMPIGGSDSTRLSICLTMSIRFIGRWPDRSEVRKSSCESAFSRSSII